MFEHRFCTPNFFLKEIDYIKIRKIIESGWVSIGENVDELESLFKKRFNVKYAIGCSSATSGLVISLKSANFKDMKIAVPSFTWPSTLYAIESNSGNSPIFCDVNKETWLIELPQSFEEYDAVLAVDIFGNQENVNNRISCPIIFDAAHGFDLPNLGKRGIAEVVSLSFTKNVTGMEGGVILTNDDFFAETAIELRRLSGRMGEINAYITLKSIEYYDNEYKLMKEEIINKYRSKFDFNFVEQKTESYSNNSVYSILFEDQNIRNSVANELNNNGIESKIYYEPLKSGFKNTDYIYSKILSLPIHPNVLDFQDKLIDIINKTVNEHKYVPGKNYMIKTGFLKK